MTSNKGGRPPKFKTVEELEAKIEEYFNSCWRQKINKFGDPIFLRNNQGKQTNVPVLEQYKPYTVVGLAVFLDTTRETLLDYEAKQGFSDTIKRAKGRCHAYAAEQLYVSKYPSAAIFNLKNNWGWK